MTFEDLQKEIGEWQTATFPLSTQQSIINHLRDEVNNELDVDCNEDELADCTLLLMGIASKRGLSLEKLILDKYEVIKKRKWGKPNAEGYQEHI